MDLAQAGAAFKHEFGLDSRQKYARRSVREIVFLDQACARSTLGGSEIQRILESAEIIVICWSYLLISHC